MHRLCAVLLVATSSLIAAQAQAQAERSWPEEKCARYRAATESVLAARGRDGLGAEFLARHDAFIAAGCTVRGDVCPRGAKEFAFADELTLRALSAGMSGTFLPFACRK